MRQKIKNEFVLVKENYRKIYSSRYFSYLWFVHVITKRKTFITNDYIKNVTWCNEGLILIRLHFIQTKIVLQLFVHYSIITFRYLICYTLLLILIISTTVSLKFNGRDLVKNTVTIVYLSFCFSSFTFGELTVEAGVGEGGEWREGSWIRRGGEGVEVGLGVEIEMNFINC